MFDINLMNSWGQKFADGGFFRVKDANVLNKAKFLNNGLAAVCWECSLASLLPKIDSKYEVHQQERKL